MSHGRDVGTIPDGAVWRPHRLLERRRPSRDERTRMPKRSTDYKGTVMIRKRGGGAVQSETLRADTAPSSSIPACDVPRGCASRLTELARRV